MIFTPKKSGLSSQEWFLYRNDAAVHVATSVQDFKGDEGMKNNKCLLYLPYITPTDLFQRRKAKSELAGMLLSQKIKTSWDGVIWSIAKDTSTATIQW